MKLKNTLLAVGAFALVLGAHATTARANDPATKVKVGKGGVSVETGGTKVHVTGTDVEGAGGDVDVETDDADGTSAVKVKKPAAAEVEAADGEQLSIVGNGKKITHTCGGDKNGATVIDVTGNNHTVTLKGACKSITVTGNNHTITIEQIGSITATGNKIDVKWKKALTGDKPEISQTGNGIKISKIVQK